MDPAIGLVSRSVLAALVAALVLAGCGAPPADDTLRVGSTDVPENRLIAEIYATGLQIRGLTVERHFGAGFPGGSVDLVPEYTGRLLQRLDPQATATAPEQVYQQAAAKLPPSLTLLDRARAEDKDVVVVTRPFASRNNLRSLADLAHLCPTVVVGGSPGFQQLGVPGLQRSYGCTFRAFRPLDAGPLAVAALRDGTVQAAELSSTDPAIPQNDLASLEDPRSTFVAQNVVPLITASKGGDPRVTEVLNKISSQLDTAVLTDLDRRLAGPDRPDPAQVARDWLASAGVG